MATAEITSLKQALRKHPELVQKDPGRLAQDFHIAESDMAWVKNLCSQCKGLYGKALEERITKCGGGM